MSIHRDTFGYVDLPDATSCDPAGDGTVAELPAARVTLRIPATLRSRIDEAAAREGMSADSWLLRAISSTLGSSRPAAA